MISASVFLFFFKAENSCSRREEKEVVSVEDNGREAEDVSQALSYFPGDQLLYIEVQYMVTLDLICMQYLCVCVIHQTVTRTTGSLTCLHNLLMRECTHVFDVIYSVRLNGCLFHGGGRSLGPFFDLGGPLNPLL